MADPATTSPPAARGQSRDNHPRFLTPAPIERALQTFVDRLVLPGRLADAIRYSLLSGGKRLRPALCWHACRAVGAAGEPSLPAAIAVELVHMATLVHDDIIDDADLRRGRDAVHTRYGNHITVLFGDFLYLKSMSLALTHDALDIVRLLCDVTLRIVEGEIYQLTKTGAVDLSEEEHFDIVRRKTALLFAGSAKIGGMLGSATREQFSTSAPASRPRSCSPCSPRSPASPAWCCSSAATPRPA